jgi:hypothetical protein
VKNVYLEQVCFNGIKWSKKGSESENGKVAIENNVDRTFFCQIIVHHKFVPENGM